MKHAHYDVIVVGGGHAGSEAAHAAARMGARTALVTMSRDGIGVMSCNPAIGGLGKGHLVREIDAMDGVMGRVADRAGIQFRLLNRRKGPAVQGPRAQADRALYKAAMLEETDARPNLDVIEGEVVDFLFAGQRAFGVALADGSEVRAHTVVLTTGTFLRGVIHIGDSREVGGRMGDKASVRLAERIDRLNLPLGRLKTGTPPRLNGRTIDWSMLESQPGDPTPELFSFLSKKAEARQIACGITHTNATTHEIIRENLSRSAMYGGHIDGVGPRYCPSIEDKVVRFADKDSHQVFLEPEGLTTDTVYPNGISTSLPADVQAAYIHSIRGLENAEIVQPGYAIEYDYVDPRALDLRLAVSSCENLFFAGQINGTTGYEEAAAQGLVAGLNAAAVALDRDPVIFSRTDSYIGVMIDDLTTRGVAEPYRMFTSRAEFRLSLRADNADQRLTPKAIETGCIGEERRVAFEDKMAKIDRVREVLGELSLTPKEVQAAGIEVAQDGSRRSGLDLLAFQDVQFSDVVSLEPSLSGTEPEIARQVKNDAIYANYIARQMRDVEALRREEGTGIPSDFDFDQLQGLSNELKGKLRAARPENLAQAGRVDGMTPAALTLILSRLRQDSRKRSA